ncbi:hypothetical protein [Nocardia otitidiscaviarum]|uniref:hypothetical protein n=1 Tax=Nocardia otitidiscaviarum TaxID=1823 RepID=UPI002454048D|nr:hypothetical protein [Nocardia otitidiscaviarum]
MADGRRPWWWRSVRARTTSVATAVVAAAMVTAGAAVLMVLRHNLIDSASLQAEMTAREVAAQLTTGVGFANLVLPDGDSQPVQVVSADGRVLAADDDLSGLPPIANFAATPRIGYANHDEDGVWDDGVLEPGAVANATFRDMKLPVAEEDTGSNDFRVAAIATTTPSGLPVTIYSATSLATADRAMIGVRDTMLIGLPLLLTLVAAGARRVNPPARRPGLGEPAGHAQKNGGPHTPRGTAKHNPQPKPPQPAGCGRRPFFRRAPPVSPHRGAAPGR